MAKDTKRHEVFSDYARSLIRLKARQLSRRADFSRSDEEDIAQDLTLHLLSQAQHFAPSRAALKTFVTHVVKRSTGNKFGLERLPHFRQSARLSIC